MSLKEVLFKNLSGVVTKQKYPGERHQQIFIGDKAVTANFSGPGTKLLRRIKQGDQPLSYTDTVAKAHDIRYSLAENSKDVRTADKIMLRALNLGVRKNLDDKRNLTPPIVGISGKIIAENHFDADPRRFANFGKKNMSQSDISLLESELINLQKRGFGNNIAMAEIVKKIAGLAKTAKETKLISNVLGLLGFTKLSDVAGKVGLGKGIKIGKGQMNNINNIAKTKAEKQLIMKLISLIKYKKANMPKRKQRKRRAKKVTKGGSIVGDVLGTVTGSIGTIGANTLFGLSQGLSRGLKQGLGKRRNKRGGLVPGPVSGQIHSDPRLIIAN